MVDMNCEVVIKKYDDKYENEGELRSANGRGFSRLMAKKQWQRGAATVFA